jgi:PadR family transcriptional regulator PadR
MAFPLSAALLDSLVLSVVEGGDTYGYELTRYIRDCTEVSESTLYPVLRRLMKNGLLECYDREYMGRNRRYYHITTAGKSALGGYRRDWEEHKRCIDSILTKGGAGQNGQI